LTGGSTRGARGAGRIARGLAALVAGVLFLGLFAILALRVDAALREQGDRRALAGEGRFVQAAGLDIHIEEAGPVDGPAVVFIHGTLAWTGTWRHILARVGAAGYRAIAIDLPPFGFSQRPAGFEYGPEAQAARIAAVLDALGIEEAVLVGHSYGGGATVEAAMRSTIEVPALVLVDVALDFPGPDTAAAGRTGPDRLLEIGTVRNTIVAATLTNRLLTRLGLERFVFDPAVVTDARVALYQKPLAVEGTTDAVGKWLVSDLLAAHHGAWSGRRDKYGNALTMPTLVVWGEQDTVTPPDQGRRLAAMLPNSELVMLDGINHIPHLEDPNRFFEALRAFLDGTVGVR
jgi:pimeloyl-ACP methyl ester carboxylesterase